MRGGIVYAVGLTEEDMNKPQVRAQSFQSSSAEVS